jgi:hypothetical protein
MEKHIKDFLIGSSISDKQAKLTILQRKEKVFIQKTDERGTYNPYGRYEWAICLNEIPDYWVSSFKTRKEAVAYCKRYKLPIVK